MTPFRIVIITSATRVALITHPLAAQAQPYEILSGFVGAPAFPTTGTDRGQSARNNDQTARTRRKGL